MTAAQCSTPAVSKSVGEAASADEPALRSLLYRSFATAFEYPDCEALGIIREGALAAAQPMRFFPELTRLLERFLEAELRRVTALSGEA